jgi:cleavage and polyadenylation specificity factor subunit 2
MGRIATTEDVEGIRDQEDVGDEAENKQEEDNSMEADNSEGIRPVATKGKGKYVATLQEVHDAFDSVNTLRYSQPTHLQGAFIVCS